MKDNQLRLMLNKAGIYFRGCSPEGHSEWCQDPSRFRVTILEKKIDALCKHLGVEIDYNTSPILPRPEYLVKKAKKL